MLKVCLCEKMYIVNSTQKDYKYHKQQHNQNQTFDKTLEIQKSYKNNDKNNTFLHNNNLKFVNLDGIINFEEIEIQNSEQSGNFDDITKNINKLKEDIEKNKQKQTNINIDINLDDFECDYLKDAKVKYTSYISKCKGQQFSSFTMINSQFTCSTQNPDFSLKFLNVSDVGAISIRDSIFQCQQINFSTFHNVYLSNIEFQTLGKGSSKNIANIFNITGQTINIEGFMYSKEKNYVCQLIAQYYTFSHLKLEFGYIYIKQNLKIKQDGENSDILQNQALELNSATLLSTYQLCYKKKVDTLQTRKQIFDFFFDFSFNNETEKMEATMNQTNSISPDFEKKFLENYSILILTPLNITTDSQTLIQGSRIGLFGNQFSLVKGAKIQASGQSCSMNSGVGKGVTFRTMDILCAGSGGSHGGYGGMGLPIILSTGSINYIQELQDCLYDSNTVMYLQEAFPYDISWCQGGSGGGFNTPIPQNYGLLGQGGGAVIIGVSEQIQIDGEILVSGQDSLTKVTYDYEYEQDLDGEIVYCGGAGSGGSIVLFSQIASGQGVLQVNGGNSCKQNNYLSGEGSGGNIQFIQLEWNKISDINQYEQFNGTVNISRGYRVLEQEFFQENSELKQLVFASQGNMMGEYCPPGYHFKYPAQCEKCPIQTFKTGIIGPCVTCLENPHKQLSQTKGNNKMSDCYNDQTSNILLIDPLIVYTNLMSGFIAPIFLVMFILILTIGYCFRKSYLKRKKFQQDVAFDFKNFTEDIVNDRALTDQLRKFDNWYLSPDLPLELEYLIVKDQYQKFMGKLNELLKITTFEITIIFIAGFLYFPLFWYLISNKRKKVWKRASIFVRDFEGVQGQNGQQIVTILENSENEKSSKFLSELYINKTKKGNTMEINFGIYVLNTYADVHQIQDYLQNNRISLLEEEDDDHQNLNDSMIISMYNQDMISFIDNSSSLGHVQQTDQSQRLLRRGLVKGDKLYIKNENEQKLSRLMRESD
ncbi:hypothetical protein PPERSA_04178 [Pseudocohnilembus persalinus]|uniref:Insulin-like growth factor binding protein, N-terminal n=1 Tax=Pseudocohnilembus persalinus TaxID=266149 RepID=A0A0V0QNE3_PSEPJ|nr:hypothetical protein PPERSA_04178 [Pseudocohnilembus persalinus]|eukprot:KRX03626.1 hypothetical protein PPERSA_04178 [Pseudocohnilembus persalinus]